MKTKTQKRVRFEGVFMGIRFPAAMSQEEAVVRAKALIPCATRDWSLSDLVADGDMVGEMECQVGFYDDSPIYNTHGPDDAGVVVEWEKP